VPVSFFIPLNAIHCHGQPRRIIAIARGFLYRESAMRLPPLNELDWPARLEYDGIVDEECFIPSRIWESGDS